MWNRLPCACSNLSQCTRGGPSRLGIRQTACQCGNSANSGFPMLSECIGCTTAGRWLGILQSLDQSVDNQGIVLAKNAERPGHTMNHGSIVLLGPKEIQKLSQIFFVVRSDSSQCTSCLRTNSFIARFQLSSNPRQVFAVPWTQPIQTPLNHGGIPDRRPEKQQNREDDIEPNQDPSESVEELVGSILFQSPQSC